jgi:hypothetical protein
MNVQDLFALALFAVLGVAALPLTRVRRTVLYVLHRGGHLAALAVVAACAAFYLGRSWPRPRPGPCSSLPPPCCRTTGPGWPGWLSPA